MDREQGVRFELRLEARLDDGARYALRLQHRALEWLGTAEISAVGEVRFEWEKEEPPAWSVAHVRAQLRMLFRDHARDGSYPRRLARWRPAPNAIPGPTE